jgi:hypothetical protein
MEKKKRILPNVSWEGYHPWFYPWLRTIVPKDKAGTKERENPSVNWTLGWRSGKKRACLWHQGGYWSRVQGAGKPSLRTPLDSPLGKRKVVLFLREKRGEI